MDGIRDASPSANLLLRPQSGCIGPAKSFRANRGGLGNDQPGRSTLRVILRLQDRRHMIVRLRAHPRERRHDDAVRKIEVPHPIWREKWLIRHLMNSWTGEAVKRCHDFADLFRLSEKRWVSAMSSDEKIRTMAGFPETSSSLSLLLACRID